MSTGLKLATWRRATSESAMVSGAAARYVDVIMPVTCRESAERFTEIWRLLHGSRHRTCPARPQPACRQIRGEHLERMFPGAVAVTSGPEPGLVTMTGS